jgi:hypothetical protein
VVTSLASLAGRRLGTGVIAVPSRIRLVARAAAVSRIRDLLADALLLDDVVPDKQRVPAGFLRPASHVGEDLRRRELPEVRHVN